MTSEDAGAFDWAGVVAGFVGRRVLVVGDVMLDEYISGDARRVCPEAPVPVVEAARRWSIPGGAANAAANVAALGGVPVLGGPIGDDAAGQELLRACRSAGIDPSGFVVDSSRPTTVKLRVLARNQQVLRIDTELAAPLPPDLGDRFAAWAERTVQTVAAVLVSDYGKGGLIAPVIQRVILAARACGCPVVVDPRGTDPAKYTGATVIKPNLTELADLSGISVNHPAAVHEAGQRVADLLPGTDLLVTRGAEGMLLFRAALPPVALPAAHARKVFDVTGAGDTAAATLTLALAGGARTEFAAQLANAAAGVVVEKVGTASASTAELLAVLAEGMPAVTNYPG